MSRHPIILAFKALCAPFNLLLRILSLPARWGKPTKTDGPVWAPPANDERHLWQVIEERRQNREPRHHLWQTIEQRRAQQAPQTATEPQTDGQPEQPQKRHHDAKRPHLWQTLKQHRAQHAAEVAGEPLATAQSELAERGILHSLRPRGHAWQAFKARRAQRAGRNAAVVAATERSEQTRRSRRRLVPVRLLGTSGRVFVPIAVIVALAAAVGSYAFFAPGGHGTATGQVGTASTTISDTTQSGGTSGYVGDTLTVSGTGFGGSAGVTVYYDGVTQTTSPGSPTTSGSGSFSGVTFTVPASPAGLNTVTVFAGGFSASANFTVNPKIMLVPTTGAGGSSDTINGTGFAAGSSPLTAKFNNSSVTLSGTTSTDSNGSFSGATYTVPSLTAASYAVTVTDASSNTASANFTIIGGSLTHFTVTNLIPAAPETAGASFTVTVTALDSSNNPATGWTSTTACVAFSGPAASPNGTQPLYPVPTGACTTGQSLLTFNGSGQATATITLYKASASTTLTVTDPVTTKTGNSVSFAVISTGTATSLSLLAATSPVTAGASDSLTITALDQYGNVDTNYSGSKALSFQGEASIGSFAPTVTNNAATPVATAFNATPNTAITFASGVASPATAGAIGQAVMVLYKTGTPSIVVSDGTISNSGLSVTVTPKAADSGGSLTLAATSPVTAGASDSLTITALDQYGNVDTNYSGSKALSFQGEASIGSFAPTVTNNAATPVATAFNATPNTAITFASGVASPATAGAIGQAVMVLYKTGTPSIVVSDGTISNSGLSVTVTPKAADSGGSLTLAATSPVTAGASDSLTITALDQYGNVDTNYSGSKALSFQGEASIGSFAPTVTNNAATPVATAFNATPNTAITFASGVASPATAGAIGQAVMVLYKTGTPSIVVSDGTISNSGLSVTVTPKAADSGGSLTLAATSPVTAGASDSLTITALDQYGNVDTNYSGSKALSFQGEASIGSFAPTVTNNAATPVATAFNATPNTAITFASGVASPATAGAIGQAVMVLYKTGTPSIVVSDGTISNSGLSVTVTPKAADSGGSLTLAATSPVTAGASDSLTITALDQYGNVDTNYSGSKALSFQGEASIGSFAPTVTNNAATPVATAFNATPNTAITFASGVASPATAGAIGQAVMVLYKTGTPSIVVSDGTISNSGLSVTVTPKAADSGGSLTLAATSPVTAGASDSLTITALDQYGNVDTNYSGSKALSFQGEASIGSFAPTVTNNAATPVATAFNATPNTAITFASGVASPATAGAIGQAVMVLYKTGTPSIVVSDGTISNSGLSVTVTPKAADSGGSLTLAATSPVTAGASDSLTITALDQYGNVDTNYSGSKALSFQGEASIGSFAPTVTNNAATPVATAFNATPNTAITFASGVASPATAGAIGQAVMVLYKTGTPSIVVSDGTISNGTGLSVTVNAAAPSTATFSTQPGGGTGGVAWSQQPQVTIKDSYGNLVTSSPVALTITTNPSSGTLTCTNNTVNTNASGIAVFASCEINKSGTGYKLTATDGGASVVSGTFNIAVGAAAQLAFTTEPSSGTVGVAFGTQPQVTVTDAGGNPVSGTSVALTITSGTGATGATLTCTNNTVSSASGTGIAAFAVCTINKSSGTTYTLTATAGALTTPSTTFTIAAVAIASITSSPQNGIPAEGDTITITFTGPVTPSSICSAWGSSGAFVTGSTADGSPNVSITVTKPTSGHNTLNVSDTTDCTADFKIFSGSSLDLGTTGYVTGTAPATVIFGTNGHCNGGHPGCPYVSIDSTDTILTIAMGSGSTISGTGTPGTVASNPGVIYTPNSGITGSDGVAVTGTATDNSTKFF